MTPDTNILSLVSRQGRPDKHRLLDIAEGQTVTSHTVTNSKISWDAFVKRLENPVITKETYAQYMSATPAEQDRIKDVGYFVFGHYTGGVRKKKNIHFRDAIALDLDHLTPDWDFDIPFVYEPYTYAIYSTHKHSSQAPRLRLVFPLSRRVTAEEYEAIARKLADKYDIEAYDKTTFQFSRVMHWPSHATDGDYLWRHNDAQWVDPNKILAEYADPGDISSWPRHAGAETRVSLENAPDPRAKPGWVGAFCRVYSVRDAMDKFLPDTYTETTDDRFSYNHGSTTNGAVLYDDDTYLYSHHESDPCSGKLVNAFDLVRLHLYGNLDAKAGADTPVHRLPSYTAIISFLEQNEPEVRAEVARENVRHAVENDFDDETHVGYDRPLLGADDMSDLFDEPSSQGVSVSDTRRLSHDATVSSMTVPSARLETTAALSPVGWEQNLQLDQHGNFRKTLSNVILILTHDVMWGHNVRLNEFSRSYVVTRPTTHHKIIGEDARVNGDPFTDKDISQIKHYLEQVYDMVNVPREMIFDAVKNVAPKFAFHPVLKYLDALPQWDGTPRLDTVLIDYLGATDNDYTRAVTRKTFCGAINRVKFPGCQWQYLLVLEGVQGIGKSRFVQTLAKNPTWFRDGLGKDLGKGAAENMAGAWIAELPEGEGIVHRENVDDIKAFLTRAVDTFRPAYGIVSERFPRQCVFIMTTNRDQYLLDETGHRRFWPVRCNATVVDHAKLEQNIDQIWAEALHRWQQKEPLFLDPALEKKANEVQRLREVDDGLTGRIQAWLEEPIQDGEFIDETQPQQFRTHTCIREVWGQCFGEPESRLTRIWSNRILAAMKKLDGWEYRPDKIKTYEGYGRQKSFVKKGSGAED